MKVLTWNLEWARPASERGKVIVSVLDQADADIICLTEAYSGTLPGGGHLIEAGSGNSVADRKCAKKVVIWSRSEWTQQSMEPDFLPLGRAVSGTTVTPLGPVDVIGVCIPWHGSGTPRFGGAAALWEDHELFLLTLKQRLSHLARPTIVLGDFNQRLPRRRQPERVWRKLEAAFSGMKIATRNFEDAFGHQTIDHIAHTNDLSVEGLTEVQRHSGKLELSDHFGVSAVLRGA